jgi:GH24 family phage-related lysozyme (muramidase)
MASMIGFVSSAIFDRVLAQSPSFEDLLVTLKSDPSLVEGMRVKTDDPDEIGLERAPLRAPKSQTPISERGSDLIVTCEVSSKKLYEARYQVPTWPRGKSGLTIGIGYDVGYVNPQELERDWREYIDADVINALKPACGVTGSSASAILRQISAQTVIPWSNAISQFQNETRPRYIGETEKSLPNIGRLNADCLGALVSVVYNRGASFKKDGDRYQEMRSIRSHMSNQNFGAIPDEIRRMKRIWEGDPDMKGVLLRRDAEAKLFEMGLQSLR